MTEHDEKLAYLLDDHAGENADASIDEVKGDVNLQYRMRRYQMIGETMRHELPPAIDLDFHKSVMASVHAEAAIAKASQKEKPAQAERAARGLSWASLKPLAGLAIAASVAVVTVALWQPQQKEGGPIGDKIVEVDKKVQELAGKKVEGSAGAVPVSTRVQTLGTRWKVKQDMPGLQQKLNGYLVNHTEYSNPVQGLIPQARVAGFDAQQ